MSNILNEATVTLSCLQMALLLGKFVKEIQPLPENTSLESFITASET